MKILVKPGAPDRLVPKPPRVAGKPPRYFEQEVATQAELDGYIQRRLDCGDLVRAEAAPAPGRSAPPPAAQPKAEG